MSQNKSYHAQRIGSYTRIVVSILRSDPELLKEENFERLRSTIYANVPELADKSKCLNCDANMLEYIYTFDVLDASLLLAMGREFHNRLDEHENFTYANQIHVQTIDASSYATKSRTTQCSKLGLIAKKRTENGAQVSGTWVITRRGFEALAGKPVPRRVKVWRGAIIDRFEGETTTISEALRTYNEKYKQKLSSKAGVGAMKDLRDLEDEFDPSAYVDIIVRDGGVMI